MAFSTRVMLLRFQGRLFNRFVHKDLRIMLPVAWYTPSDRTRFLTTTSSWVQTEEQRKYADTIDDLATHLLALLNARPMNNLLDAWTFQGFIPRWIDNRLITLTNNRRKRHDKQQRQQEKQEQKRKTREEKLAQRMAELGKTPSEPPTTGAGRRIGAVPGIFKGVMFRSQLEIRFVTQLEAKHIRWIYEGERLGEGQYLVDFYLPDLKCWIEVKGRLEPRDDYLLKEIADYLKRERDERLFIYTQHEAYSVNARRFRKLTHAEFWSTL